MHISRKFSILIYLLSYAYFLTLISENNCISAKIEKKSR